MPPLLRGFEMRVSKKDLIIGCALSGCLAALASVSHASDGVDSLAQRLVELRDRVETLHQSLDLERQQHRNKMTVLTQRQRTATLGVFCYH